MSCVQCSGEFGVIPEEDIKRWTNSLRQLLESKEGRSRFQQFLLSRNLTSASDTLAFWEECDKFLSSTEQSTSSRRTKHHCTREKLINDANHLYSFADDKINFDAHQMRTMMAAIKSGKEEEIRRVFHKAKQTAKNLLRDDYKRFVEVLLQDRKPSS